MANYYGSICVSDIPKEAIEWVECKDGIRRGYVQIRVRELKEPRQQGNRKVTHFVACGAKKEKRDEWEKAGKKMIWGDLAESEFQTNTQPQQPPVQQPQQPVQQDNSAEDLPF